MYGSERERLAGFQRNSIDGCYSSLVVQGCLAVDVHAMIDISVVNACVVEVYSCRVVFAVGLSLVGFERVAVSCVYAGQPHVPSAAVPSYVAASGRLRGVMLALHLTLGAVIARLQQGLDSSVLV